MQVLQFTVGTGTLLCCLYVTGQRVPAWHDNRALWEAAVTVSARPGALINAAHALYSAHDDDRALSRLDEAVSAALDKCRPPVRQKEDWLMAQADRAVVLTRLGRARDAEATLFDLLAVMPSYGPANRLLPWVQRMIGLGQYGDLVKDAKLPRS